MVEADPTYLAATRLSTTLRQMPDGPRVLRDMGAEALKNPAEYTEMFEAARGKFLSNMQLAQSANVAFALQTQALPEHREGLRQAFDAGGTPGALTYAQQHGGSAIYAADTAARRGMDDFTRAMEQSGADRAAATAKFEGVLRSSAPLGNEGVLGDTRNNMLTTLSNMTSGVSADMSNIFGDSVGTFRASAEMMYRAGELWMRNATRQNRPSSGLEMPL